MDSQAHVTIVSPSGYRFILKSSLNYGEYLQVQRVFMDAMEIDGDGKVGQVPASVVMDATKKAAGLLIVEAFDPDGQRIDSPDIYSLPIEDGQAIANKIDEVTSAATLTEKKSS